MFDKTSTGRNHTVSHLGAPCIHAGHKSVKSYQLYKSIWIVKRKFTGSAATAFMKTAFSPVYVDGDGEEVNLERVPSRRP